MYSCMCAVVCVTTGQSDVLRCIGLGRADWKQQHASNDLTRQNLQRHGFTVYGGWDGITRGHGH